MCHFKELADPLRLDRQEEGVWSPAAESKVPIPGASFTGTQRADLFPLGTQVVTQGRPALHMPSPPRPVLRNQKQHGRDRGYLRNLPQSGKLTAAHTPS